MAKFAVIGVGRFGYTVATQLFKSGAEVVALDNDPKALETVEGKVTTAIKLDSTDEYALKRVGITDFDAVVLAIGANVEASILTCAILKKMGVNNIYAKVDSKIHSRILEMVGVQKIYFPEEKVGNELSKYLLSNNILSYVSLEDDLSIIELLAPESFVGQTLQQLALPSKKNINVITIKSRRFDVSEDGENIIVEDFKNMPGANDVVKEGDILVLLGPRHVLDQLILETG